MNPIAAWNPYRVFPLGYETAVECAFLSPDISLLHRSIPEYKPTPLISLPGLARKMNLGRIYIKDESHRFGLKAFKALGATYAVYRWFKERSLSRGFRIAPAEEFFLKETPISLRQITFCTATDGNHGRGVAWTARKLGQKAVIYMPGGSALERVENIRRENAEVILVAGNYDDAVSQCAIDAARNGWQIISDTSWPGYDDIPRWIMAGYLTLFREIEEQKDKSVSFEMVIIPAGVGALAAAAGWYFRRERHDEKIKLVSVEPLGADCFLRSIQSPAGTPISIKESCPTLMAGLNCGTPSPVAWPIVRQCFDLFLAISDDYVRTAMRQYYYPEDRDPRIISGESGASGLAALLSLYENSISGETGQKLGLNQNSSVLLLNTEGDTAPEIFLNLTGDNYAP